MSPKDLPPDNQASEASTHISIANMIFQKAAKEGWHSNAILESQQKCRELAELEYEGDWMLYYSESKWWEYLCKPQQLHCGFALRIL
jgi:hypothetical protein